ncbi:MAG: sensor histidine kinase N-terminal domain-containing protein [Salinisphaera sp.]|uniref:sensor histidine kinase n=1 Tax=Salinisphaera sp. TaxID=1914330 RepID=UPI003C7B053D
MSSSTHTAQRRPSLRRRLLLFLLVPMLVILTTDAVITYFVALTYANRVHDEDLADDARTLATMLQTRSLKGTISPQARFLLEFDPDGHNYFAIRSQQQGLIAGSRILPPVASSPQPGQAPRLYDTHLKHTALRAATIAIADPKHNHGILDITVAQTFQGRRQVARQILLLNISLQVALSSVLLLLVWLGVRFGLRVINPLTRRLSRREHDLSPIEDDDVPVELLPLTHTIDALFARLRDIMALHERFIADAAHQLRTPLAGLRLQVERAMHYADDPRAHKALEHIQQLTGRTARTSVQLLALTRAEARPMQMAPVDLRTLLPDLAGQRVPEAIEAEIDFGFETTHDVAWVNGDAIALQEALDNLIDNALRYTPRKGTVTLTLSAESDALCLQIDDSGPGVDADVLPRLGERFFRAPDNRRSGTGLGLAIVRHIVMKHQGTLCFERSLLGGLSVRICLPRLPVVPRAAEAGHERDGRRS